MRWFFEQTVERPGVLDDEVASVRSERVREPQGVFGDGEARRTLGAKEARRKEEDADGKGGRPWRSTVLVRRRGEVALPTSLRLDFEGGEARTIALLEGEPSFDLEAAALDGSPPAAARWGSRWKRVELTGEKRLVSATIDPEDRLVLDVNRLNNARRVEPDGRAAARWGARWVFWLQQLLAVVGL